MSGSKKYCFACDLKDDPQLIKRYREHHEQIWPEITKSIKSQGIVDMQIYLTGNRLYMIMEVDDSYNPEAKRIADLSNPKVQEWENLMSTFQQILPWSNGEKWVMMDEIFTLKSQ